jgi:uncharacterized membrane protein YjfL (UPF0719 family)
MLTHLLDSNYLTIFIANLTVVILLLTLTKYISSWITHANLNNELSIKDNTAFGISLAGAIISLTLVLTGAISGQAHDNLFIEMAMVLMYGVISILLMICSRFVFDKISMPNFCLKTEILAGNNACAILDFGHSLASAIIISSVTIWIADDNFTGLAYLIGGYLVSQLVLNLISSWRLFLYNRHHSTSMQDSLQSGNVAVAMRFSGLRIAMALAISAGSNFVAYDQSWWQALSQWLVFSMSAIILVAILSTLLDKIILAGINLRDEVDNQANLAVAMLQASIAISMALIILALAG